MEFARTGGRFLNNCSRCCVTEKTRQNKKKSHDGKQPYGSLKEALVDLYWIRIKHPTWGYMQAYDCRHCPGWHLGHPPRKRKPKRKKHR